MMRRSSLFCRAFGLTVVLVLVPTVGAFGQSSPSAGFRNGFFGPFDGYGAIWAYPSDYSNGPSPYYSPIFNSMAASRPSPTLEPSPYYRSPLDLLRFNQPEAPRPFARIFRRR
ncbi:hypothetical protein [Tautonia rosea]|uniref:hypothetical protein n=1 Tax=Tautonia rosea TaxID=2728037 RepID=UPI001474C7D2|nr:hypothetical protein [Tautonia rosea]